MTRPLLLPPVLALTLLAACSVGPDHERPDPAALRDAPDAFTEADGPAREAADQTAWWHTLNDPPLAAAVERALAQNFSLVEARERVVAARARRGIVNADRLPALDAQGSYARIESGDDAQPLIGVPPGIETDVYSLGAVAGWEIDLWGRVGRLVDAADAEIGFAAADLDAARLSVAAEVARRFVELRALDAEIAIVRAGIDTDRAAYDIARDRAAAGLTSELDALRALRILEADRALLPALIAARRATAYALTTLTAQPAADAPALLQPTRAVALPEPQPLPALGAPASLLTRRPDLRRAEQDLAAATFRIGAAQAERFPRLTLTGSINLQGPDIGDATNPDAFVLNAGPGLTLPLFRGGAIAAGVRVAEARQRQALARYEQAVLDAVAEVETATVRRSQAAERVDRLSDALRAAEATETLARDRYTAGASDFLAVTEAQTQRLAIERARLTAARDRLLARINLHAALGGGF